MANMQKVKEIFADAEVMAQLDQCTTVEESLAFLNDKGAELTADELKELAAAVVKAADTKDEAMDMNDMESVAGGGFFGAVFGFAGNVISYPAQWGKKIVTSAVTSAIDLFT